MKQRGPGVITARDRITETPTKELPMLATLSHSPAAVENAVRTPAVRSPAARTYIRRLGEGKGDAEYAVHVNFSSKINQSICCACGDQLDGDTAPGPGAVASRYGKTHGHICMTCLLSPEPVLRNRVMRNLAEWRNAVRASTKGEPLWLELLAIDSQALAVVAGMLTYGLLIEARGLRRFLTFHGYQPADLKCYDVPELNALAAKVAP